MSTEVNEYYFSIIDLKKSMIGSLYVSRRGWFMGVGYTEGRTECIFIDFYKISQRWEKKKDFRVLIDKKFCSST